MREDVTSAHKPSPAEIASQALAAMVISHVKVRNMNFRPKGIYLATMARRVLMAMIDESMVDDRDYVGNKRLELYVNHSIVDGVLMIVLDKCLVCYLKMLSRPSMRISRDGWTRFSKRSLEPVHSRDLPCLSDHPVVIPTSQPLSSGVYQQEIGRLNDSTSKELVSRTSCLDSPSSPLWV
jgi:hypothetical protein